MNKDSSAIHKAQLIRHFSILIPSGYFISIAIAISLLFACAFVSHVSHWLSLHGSPIDPTWMLDSFANGFDPHTQTHDQMMTAMSALVDTSFYSGIAFVALAIEFVFHISAGLAIWNDIGMPWYLFFSLVGITFFDLASRPFFPISPLTSPLMQSHRWYQSADAVIAVLSLIFAIYRARETKEPKAIPVATLSIQIGRIIQWTGLLILGGAGAYLALFLIACILIIFLWPALGPVVMFLGIIGIIGIVYVATGTAFIRLGKRAVGINSQETFLEKNFY